MLHLMNTLGRKLEPFKPANPNMVNVFTCGPSVYKPAHIGNFRTFAYEDMLVRYLEYSGYSVCRGMTITDIEDKAVEEAELLKQDVFAMTEVNLRLVEQEMNLLHIRKPEFFEKASDHVTSSVKIIQTLLDKGIAYWYDGNVYFDPRKVPGFGKLYQVDMSRWPSNPKRFHKDTYPDMRWNRGDFILWHGERSAGSVWWESAIGRGRPSWNVQDGSIVADCVEEPLSIYCGGIDNLVRHHDYNIAILESVRPYPMALTWLHGGHLYVDGYKMSKSRGNIIYTHDLIQQGYSAEEIRFFLLYAGHYRARVNFTSAAMQRIAERLRSIKKMIESISARAAGSAPADAGLGVELTALFTAKMDEDLNLRGAVDALAKRLAKVDAASLSAAEAAGALQALQRIDHVLQAFF
jgi:cysteinyl-tRNA synthetase